MDYRTLGTTGVKVSPLCLGAMMFGDWGDPDPDNGIRIIHRALDAGINFIDTADVYSRGGSEEIVGKALAGGKRDNVILATKVHGTMGDDPNEFGNSRRWIVREVENSLRRLGTDWIDLYQIHRPEADTDIDETLGALTDLVRAGKVRYIGSSTFPASQIVEAQWAAERRGRERFVCEQPPYSMLIREIEKDVLPTTQRYGMGVIPWSPLAGGWLSGRYRVGEDAPGSHRADRIPDRYDLSQPANQRKLEAADALARVAEEAGMTLIEMAIAFVIRHPGGDRGDHRPAHDGAPRVPADRSRRPPLRRDARQDRRDRPARGQRQPGRRWLAQPGPRAGGAPALGDAPAVEDRRDLTPRGGRGIRSEVDADVEAPAPRAEGAPVARGAVVADDGASDAEVLGVDGEVPEVPAGDAGVLPGQHERAVAGEAGDVWASALAGVTAEADVKCREGPRDRVRHLAGVAHDVPFAGQHHADAAA